jgi:hypothetical protein
VAIRIETGQQIRLVGEQLRRTRRAPFDGRRSLTLAYSWTAEASCYEALGWQQPWWPVDCYAEFLATANGLFDDATGPPPDGGKDERHRYRLIDALRFFGVEVGAEDEARKHRMQERAGQGEPFDPEERTAITAYCADDVHRLIDLFRAMRPQIDLPAAVVRARYMTAVAQQTYGGIPVDVEQARRFQAFRPDLRLQLIGASPSSRFYTGGRFRQALLEDWAEEEEIGLPRNPSGSPVLERNALKKLAVLEPRLAPLALLRSQLEQLEELRIAPRSDGRIRASFWPLKTRTGRNRPRASELPLLKAKWSRGFILAPPGRALAQLDFKSQEIYVAAYLSNDPRLIEDLEVDPYLRFAVRAGFAPVGATEQSHHKERDMSKRAMLGLIYGMGERTLAERLGVDVATAREIRAQFRRDYRTLWDWLEAVVRVAYGTRHLETQLGWPLTVGPRLDSYTLRNHLIQSTGGDILRASCLYAPDDGLGTIATLHDSVLLEAEADQIEAHAAKLGRAMTRGAESVIGFPIPAKIEFNGRRYRLDGAAAQFYEEISRRLELISQTG